MTCPRCGKPLYEPSKERRRGRPRRWCSAECRKLASDERRAANRRAVRADATGRPAGVERGGYQSPDGAVERVLLDPFSIEKLLRTLTRRIQDPRNEDTAVRWFAERQRHLVADLMHAVDHDRSARAPQTAQRPEPPPAGTASQDAVRTVLSSPRATREVLDALAEQANDGNLLDGRHSGTVNAAERLLKALIRSRTLRPHPRLWTP